MKKLITAALLTVMVAEANAGGIIVSDNARIITGNSSSVVIADGGLVNDSASGIGGSGRFLLSGTTPQSIGGTQTSLFYVLELNNSAGVTLAQSGSIAGALTFTGGTLTLNNHNLKLQSTAVVNGASSGRYVVTAGSGELQKEFTGLGSFTYPVGDGGSYSPVTVAITSGTFSAGNSVGMRVTADKYPSIAASSYLNRYWSLTASGISAYQADITAAYSAADVTGSEGTLSSVYLNPAALYGYPAFPVDHTLSINGISTAGALTAMAASVSPTAPYNMEVRSPTETGKLTVTWNRPNDPLVSHVHVYRSTALDQLGALVGDNISIVSFTDTGLLSGTPYYYLIRTVTPSGIESSNTVQVYGTTLADALLPDNVSGLSVTDTTFGGELLLAWTNPNSANFAGVNVYRSTINGERGTLVSSDAIASWRDTGLTSNTTYYYTITTRDTYGQESIGVVAGQIPTNSVPPFAVSGLKAALLAGGQVNLTWTRSASGDVAYYNIYGDNGTGTINYGATIGRIAHPATSWTSSSLNSGTSYRFAVRVEDATGLSESNTDRVVGVQTVADPTPLAAVIPDSPKTGDTLSGSMVSVSARLLSGSAANITSVTFQYRPASGGAWSDISTDNSFPYSANWDTTLLSGGYHLRTVAGGSNTIPVDENVFVTVSVSSGAIVTENLVAAGKERVQTLQPTAPSEIIMTGGDGKGTMRVAFAEGAVITGGTVTITDLNPATAGATVPASYGNAGLFRSIAVGGGMQLDDKTTTVELPYLDSDGNGIVDGTSVKAVDLKVCHYSGGAWQCLDSLLDSANHRIRAQTPGFSSFALLAPPVPVGAGWNFISVPMAPSPNSVSSVFGSATPYSSYTSYWDANSQTWATATSVLPGRGYIVWGSGVSSAKLTVTGTETADIPQTLTLAKGWNLIGQPFRYRVNVADLSVTYAGQTKSFKDAQTAGWVAATAYKYASGAYQYQTPDNSGTLDAWTSYWILADVPCTLTIPNILAQ